MTFSHTCAFALGLVTSRLSSVSPPVRSLWLWHVMQYWSRTAWGPSEVVEVVEVGTPYSVVMQTLTNSATIDARPKNRMSGSPPVVILADWLSRSKPLFRFKTRKIARFCAAVQRRGRRGQGGCREASLECPVRLRRGGFDIWSADVAVTADAAECGRAEDSVRFGARLLQVLGADESRRSAGGRPPPPRARAPSGIFPQRGRRAPLPPPPGAT